MNAHPEYEAQVKIQGALTVSIQGFCSCRKAKELAFEYVQEQILATLRRIFASKDLEVLGNDFLTLGLHDFRGLFGFPDGMNSERSTPNV